MKLTELFLDQLESEIPATRRVLERVPERRNDWRPHDKSMPLGYLAALVANMPGWIDFMVNRDFLDVASPEGAKFKPQVVATNLELLQAFGISITRARDTLQSTNDEHLLKPWKFLAGGPAVSERPRYAMIREAVFSHLAHHRGQLTVYLRLNNVKVPSIYGPTADEQ